ncbi:hypothetical protein [Ruminococcus albus]|uniref:Uncharacterized protein n=1 Tax=Ruminococcus albus TaxID=1264 RepID=A0A1H7I3L2_RUMAL|nr:hypothetical protein [Ruminococcus albus]SEK56030.1 hypothetical protein SAMN05216469_103186 [Ruminococcus albus]
MSNKKLTTEEKIEKSKEYEDEMSRLQNKMKTMRAAKKKLDAEIADELEKAEIVTDQAVGKKFRSKMSIALPLDKYSEIIDFMFMHEDCVEFIDEVIAKYRHEQEAAKAKNQEEQSIEENGEAAESVLADDSDNIEEKN